MKNAHKRNIIMNVLQKTGIAGLIALALLACEQPFKAGLGPIKDIKKPVITLITPGPGAYIKGITELTGTVWDDIKVVSAEIKVTTHTTFTNPLDEYYNEFINYTPMTWNSKGEWTKLIDSQRFPDGDIKIKLKVTDSDGKYTESDEIPFIIKNTRPSVRMSIPSISELGDTWAAAD